MHRNVPKSVAQRTGGEYFKFENRRDLAPGLITISNLIPNSYVLSFSPQADGPDFHLIDVQLKDRTGLHIEAKKVIGQIQLHSPMNPWRRRVWAFRAVDIQGEPQEPVPVGRQPYVVEL